MSALEKTCHKWVHLKEDEAGVSYSSCNMSCSNSTLYSYSSTLAKIDRERKVIIIDASTSTYSTSSQRHTRYLRGAIPDEYTVFTYNRHENPTDYYLREVIDLLTAATRARISDYVTPAIRLLDEAVKYISIYKLDKRKRVVKELLKLHAQSDNLLEEAKEVIAKAGKAKRLARAKEAKQEQESRQLRLNKFIGNSSVTYDPTYKSVYLKVEGSSVLTSNSVTVPLRETLLLYKMYLAGKKVLGLKLDGMVVVKAGPRMVKIGCTEIAAKEMDRVLKPHINEKDK